MATTKIWSVHGRIGDVIGYAENPDKTANPQFAPPDLQALRDVMNYATNDFKTERQFYVTGLNCVPEIARDQMTLTKRRFGKENGIVAFHAYQSFAPGEVTADSAHALGVELGYQKAYRPLLPESKHYPLKDSLRHIRKATGFRALYLHYCYLLGAFPKHPPPKLSFVLRQELVKFDQIMAQRKLLTQYRIDTAEQLSSFIAAKEQQLAELAGARTAIVNRLRRCSDEPTTIALKERRSSLTAEIGLCRQELMLTAPIPQRVAEIQRNLLLQQQQETRLTQPAKSKKKEMIR